MSSNQNVTDVNVTQMSPSTTVTLMAGAKDFKHVGKVNLFSTKVREKCGLISQK